MFKLFRRGEPPAPPPKRQSTAARPAPAAAGRRSATPAVHEPPPVPDVHEDHDESAWDLWEQSQFQLDSQLGGLSPADTVRVRQDRSSQLGGLDDDPFSRIGKNDR